MYAPTGLFLISVIAFFAVIGTVIAAFLALLRTAKATEQILKILREQTGQHAGPYVPPQHRIGHGVPRSVPPNAPRR